MRKRIRLTENDLYRIVAESVRKIMNEGGEGATGGSVAAGGDGASNASGLGVDGSYPYYDAPVNAGKPINRKFFEPTTSRPIGKMTTKQADEETSNEVNKRNSKR